MDKERTEADKDAEEAADSVSDERWERFVAEVVEPTVKAVEARQRRRR